MKLMALATDLALRKEYEEKYQQAYHALVKNPRHTLEVNSRGRIMPLGISFFGCVRF